MLNRFLHRVAPVVVAWAVAAQSHAAVTLHVSPEGDDANDGSPSQPVATLAAAQRLARRAIAERPQAVRVEIAPGAYFLEETLVFGNEDAGPTAERSVAYAAVGGDVVLSGARRITGWREEGERWVAEVKIAPGAPAFRDLWVNGQRAVRARTPNDGYFRVEAAGPDNRTSFTAAQGELVDIAKPQTAEAVLLHDWSTSRVPLASIDAGSRTYGVIAPLGGEAAQFAITNFEPHPRYFIENAPELLDAPGEWHLDEAAGKLYYLPRDGETINRVEATAPRLERLLVVRGQGELPVQHLRFEGLTFAYSRWELPPYGYAGIQSHVYERRTAADDRQTIPMAAAVEIDRAQDCQFANCRFMHLAACGLKVAQSQNVHIDSCRFQDVGGDGVLIGARNDGQMPPTAQISITDCLIENCGVNFFGAVGLWIGFASDTLVAHNELRNLPYTGVSAGWRWDDTPSNCQGNRIESNHIHHAMQILSDGGGIYTLGRQPGTRLAANFIHDIPLNAGRAESNGIFMDEGSTEITVEDNTICGVARSPIRFHRAGKNLVRNNRLAAPPGVPTFMYNATDASLIDRVDNDEISDADWQAPADDSARSTAGPRR
ncbi:MAG: right-handed parallel beta-helix repeat-containing protein [Pirellulales bacterium]|nr:right-handed parallel beta-helix repeat-containing protein [Pirellulales bacterium]